MNIDFVLETERDTRGLWMAAECNLMTYQPTWWVVLVVDFMCNISVPPMEQNNFVRYVHANIYWVIKQ